MSSEFQFVITELYSTGPAYQPEQLRTRNLGSALLVTAIADYCGLDQEAHDHAEQFLYPQTTEWQDHYDWAVALADGLNPAWLRDALDRFRGRWDRRRCARLRAKQLLHLPLN